MAFKVNKWTQELTQLDPHKVLNMKGKDRQIQLNSYKKKDDKQSRQLFQKTVASLLAKLNWIYL